jgi:hypothetical protein
VKQRETSQHGVIKIEGDVKAKCKMTDPENNQANLHIKEKTKLNTNKLKNFQTNQKHDPDPRYEVLTKRIFTKQRPWHNKVSINTNIHTSP